MIIAITGERGAGKSLFGKIAIEKGFPVLEMSEPVINLMRELGIEITNESVRTFASDLREKGGPDAVAKLLLPKIRAILREKPAVVVIGARSEEEITTLLSADRVVTVAIVADDKTRFWRIRKRGRPGDPQNFLEFKWADEVESGWGLKKLISSCEFRIENNGGEEEFRAKAENLLDRLR